VLLVLQTAAVYRDRERCVLCNCDVGSDSPSMHPTWFCDFLSCKFTSSCEIRDHHLSLCNEETEVQ
jgi:hypothetical protein